MQDDALISIELGKTWKYKNRMELYKVDIIWVDSPAYPNFCKKKKPRKMYFYEIVSLYKSTNHTWLKGRTGMLTWHAIPFLKGLGMLTPNPCENG